MAIQMEKHMAEHSNEKINDGDEDIKKFELDILSSNKKYLDDFRTQMEQQQKIIEELILSNTDFISVSMNMLKASSNSVISIGENINSVFDNTAL